MASLHIEKEYDDMLNALKTIHGMDKKQLAELSIRYIYKNKINPVNIKESDPSAELKTLRKDLIGFIKTQEKELLNPMKDRLDYLVESSAKSNTTQVSGTNPTEDYAKLAQSYKALVENHNKLVQSYKTQSENYTSLTEHYKSIATFLKKS